jgi:hypothetical protein
MDINVAQFYAKARGSKWFLIGLLGIIATWLTVSNLTGFDKDHGLINLFLSAEASLSLAFFTLLNDKQNEKFEQILQAIQNQDKQLLDVVEEIHEEVTDGH